MKNWNGWWTNIKECCSLLGLCFIVVFYYNWDRYCWLEIYSYYLYVYGYDIGKSELYIMIKDKNTY